MTEPSTVSTDSDCSGFMKSTDSRSTEENTFYPMEHRHPKNRYEIDRPSVNTQPRKKQRVSLRPMLSHFVVDVHLSRIRWSIHTIDCYVYKSTRYCNIDGKLIYLNCNIFLGMHSAKERGLIFFSFSDHMSKRKFKTSKSKPPLYRQCFWEIVGIICSNSPRDCCHQEISSDFFESNSYLL